MGEERRRKELGGPSDSRFTAEVLERLGEAALQSGLIRTDPVSGTRQFVKPGPKEKHAYLVVPVWILKITKHCEVKFVF